MGASTRDSLKMVADPTAKPPYGTCRATVCRTPTARYSRATASRAADFMDGLSHTIMTMETMDQAASRWMVGKEATLVGLPQKSSPTGSQPQAPYQLLCTARL